LRKPDDGKHNCLENKDVEKRIEELENSELKLSAEIQKKNEEILVLKSAKSRPQSVVNSSANDLESISESLGINRYSNKTQIINKIESLLNRPNGSVSACNHYDYDKLKDKLEAEIKLLKGNIKEAEELSKQSLANLQSVGFKVTAEETKLINSAASIGKKIEVLSESNKGK
jgi:uncharacterized protein (DUF1778 family)